MIIQTERKRMGRYNPFEKELLIKTYRKSKMKIADFCQLHDVSTTAMKKWMDSYDAQGIEGLARSSKIDILPEGVDRTEENYKDEILKLRIENERLKKNYAVRTTEDGRKVFVRLKAKSSK